MPTKAEIVNQIEEQIIPNLMELITGGILQNVLLGMVDQINTLVGELDDLNTDDRSSIVNAINELVNNIQAIEDNLTPYVYFGTDDPNIVTPVGFGGDIPSFYVQQQHSGLDVVNIGFWTYTGIIGKEWVDLSLSSGEGSESFIELNDTPSSYTSQAGKVVAVKGDETGVEFIDNPNETLTLEQARLNGNVLEGDVEFAESDFIGFKVPQSDDLVWGFFRGDGDRDTFGNKTNDKEHGLQIQENVTSIYARKFSTDKNVSFLVDTYHNEARLEISGESKGLVGLEEFDKQGDRKAFAQIADLEDSITAREQTIRMILTPEGEDASVKDVIGFFADGDYDIISVNATAKTAPTGSAIEIGLKVNGVDVTDVPITIASGDKTSFGSTPAEFTATIGLGDEITPSILSVGSTIKGKDLQLIFKYKEII